MNILITGAKGFVGRNLVEYLKTIRDGKNRTTGLAIGDIYEYDIDTDPALLDNYCARADFVFNLAGVNRPQNQEEFMAGNFGFASTLLDTHYATAVNLESSRDSVSAVDLNDEAMNMTMYQQAYTAACRLMTTLDSVLDKLINGTGIT